MRREQVDMAALGAMPFDLFVSAFNKTDRVADVYAAVVSTEKHWLVHSEYRLADSELPGGELYVAQEGDEAQFWRGYFDHFGHSIGDFSTRTVCVDITGILQPHLLVLLALARHARLSQLTLLYADPIGYKQAEDTAFSNGSVQEVRQVRGYEGSHMPDAGEEDLLIIGAGYDDELISRVAESRRNARKMQLFGLPGSKSHMYQESRVRASRARESVGPQSRRDILFAPADNPYVTAEVLQGAVAESKASTNNLYLSPLGTKPQVVGFGLFYLFELERSAASVIYPFAESYSAQSSFGMSRTWRFDLELNW